jgi:multiple sugar transport system permease protein
MMDHSSSLEKTIRGVLLTLVVIFFMFPILWILLMSFQTNATIIRSPPSFIFTPTLENYVNILSGQLKTSAANLKIEFILNLWNSFLLSSCAVALSLLLGVPAAYAFARFKFRLGEDIAFTLLSFRFAPALLVLLPLKRLFTYVGLDNTYIGLIWVYQLICLPLILWIVRGYFEDLSPDIEHAHRISGYGWFDTFRKIAVPLALPGIAAAGLLAFIFAWNNFVFALVLASAEKQPVTVGALAFITASGIPYGLIAAAIVISVIPTFILALFAQRYLVEGLSLGAVKG